MHAYLGKFIVMESLRSWRLHYWFVSMDSYRGGIDCNKRKLSDFLDWSNYKHYFIGKRMDGGDNDIGDGLSNDGSEKGTFACLPSAASLVCVCGGLSMP